MADDYSEFMATLVSQRLYTLTIGNFKGFGVRQTAPLAPLTLVYGPNSAGKSSLLHALALLGQSAVNDEVAGPLAFQGEHVDLGGIRSALFAHDAKRPMSLGFSTETGEVEFEFKGAFEKDGDDCRVTAARIVDAEQRTLSIKEQAEGRGRRGRRALRLVDAASSETWRCWLAEEAQQRPTLRAFLEHSATREAFHRNVSPRVDFTFLSLFDVLANPACVFGDKTLWPEAGDAGAELDEWVHYGGPTNARLSHFSDAIRKLSYLGPLRQAPSRHYVPTTKTFNGVGRTGENLIALLHAGGPSMWRQVDHWLKRLEIPYSIDLVSTHDDVMGTLRALRLRSTRGHPSAKGRRGRAPIVLSPADVGFGIGQVLPILLEGLVSGAGLVCVEQPEIHLHPRLQAELTDFFIQTSGVWRGDGSFTDDVALPRQWIVETHSETMIQRLLRRVRDGHLAPEDVSIIYVHPGLERKKGRYTPPAFDGSVIMPMRIDEEGRFVDQWPDGFFEENLREMLA